MQQLDRRRFLGAAAMTIAASQIGGRAAAAPALGPLKQVDAGLLKVTYMGGYPAWAALVERALRRPAVQRVVEREGLNFEELRPA